MVLERRIGLISDSMIFLQTIGQFSEHAGSYFDKIRTLRNKKNFSAEKWNDSGTRGNSWRESRENIRKVKGII